MQKNFFGDGYMENVESSRTKEAHSMRGERERVRAKRVKKRVKVEVGVARA